MVRFISSLFFGCFNKQTSCIKQPEAFTKLKEKVVPLALTPSSTWKEQNLGDFLLLLALTNETSNHELNEAFLESLEYTLENLDNRLSKTVYEAPAKKSVSFNLNENIEYEEDNEFKEELVEYRKSVGMNLYYYFRRMERDERRERIRRLKRVLTYPWRAMANVFRGRRRRTVLVDNI